MSKQRIDVVFEDDALRVDVERFVTFVEVRVVHRDLEGETVEVIRDLPKRAILPPARALPQVFESPSEPGRRARSIAEFDHTGADPSPYERGDARFGQAGARAARHEPADAGPAPERPLVADLRPDDPKRGLVESWLWAALRYARDLSAPRDVTTAIETALAVTSGWLSPDDGERDRGSNDDRFGVRPAAIQAAIEHHRGILRAGLYVPTRTEVLIMPLRWVADGSLPPSWSHRTSRWRR